MNTKPAPAYALEFIDMLRRRNQNPELGIHWYLWQILKIEKKLYTDPEMKLVWTALERKAKHRNFSSRHWEVRFVQAVGDAAIPPKDFFNMTDSKREQLITDCSTKICELLTLLSELGLQSISISDLDWSHDLENPAPIIPTAASNSTKLLASQLSCLDHRVQGYRQIKPVIKSPGSRPQTLKFVCELTDWLKENFGEGLPSVVARTGSVVFGLDIEPNYVTNTIKNRVAK